MIAGLLPFTLVFLAMFTPEKAVAEKGRSNFSKVGVIVILCSNFSSKRTFANFLFLVLTISIPWRAVAEKGTKVFFKSQLSSACV